MLTLVKTSTHTGPLTIKDQNQKDQKDFLDLRFIYFVIFYCKKLVDFKLNTLSMFLILVSMRQEEDKKKVKILTLAEQRI